MAEQKPAKLTDAETSLSLDILPELAELIRLSAWVDDAGAKLGLSVSRLYAVQLCLEELVANIVLHARAAEPAKLAIAVTLSPSSSGLEIKVDDNGMMFDPTVAAESSPAHSLADAPLGGLGLVLVRRFTSSFQYRRDNGWNRVTVLLAG